MLDILLYIGLVSAGYILGDIVGWLSVIRVGHAAPSKETKHKSYSHLREKAILNNLSYNHKAEPTSVAIYDAEVIGDNIKINEVI